MRDILGVDVQVVLGAVCLLVGVVVAGAAQMGVSQGSRGMVPHSGFWLLC